MIAFGQVVLAFYALGCIGFGSLLMRVFARDSWRMDGQPGLAVATVYFILGMGVLANLWIILGLLGWLSPWVVAAVIALLIVASLRTIRSLFKRIVQDIRSGIADFKRDSLAWKLLIILTFLLVLFEGISSLLPASGDAAAFYMPISRVTAASHRLVPLRGWDYFSQIGLAGELHNASLIMLSSVAVAKEFAWLIGLAAAVMVAAVGAKVGLGRKGQWIAVIMVLTSSAVTKIMMSGKVDLVAASLGAAAFYWALHWGGSHQIHSLRIAGLLTGMAVIAKLSYAAALVPAILILILWKSASARVSGLEGNRLWTTYVGPMFHLGLWMALATIPHLLKNGLQFGQPLAPFLSPSSAFILDQEWASPEVTRMLLLTYPIALVFSNYPMQGGNLSPLMLAYLPLVLRMQKPRRFLVSPLVQLTLSALFGVIVWTILRPSIFAPRYILALLVMFVPVLAKGAEIADLGDPRMQLLGAGTAVCALAIVLFRTVTVATHANDALLFQTGIYSPCEKEGANCRALDSLSQQADEGARIFLAEFYRDWLRVDLLQCVSDGDEFRALEASQTSAEGWSYLFERGFEYVAINQGTHAFIGELLDVNLVPEWLDASETSEGGFRVIHLSSKDPTRKPGIACQQVDSPAWEIVPVD